MFHIFGRLLAAGTGCTLLYLAFFLYEDERGQLQNRLEELWVSIDDEAQRARSRNTAFLRGIVRIVSGMFDRFFGPKILSARAVVVSFCYSISSYAIACAANALYNSPYWGLLPGPTRVLFAWLGPPITLTNLWVAASGAIFYGLLGSFPALSKKSDHRVWLVVAAFSICGSFAFIFRSTPYKESSVVPGFMLLFAFGLAVASDFILLTADRKLLRWSLSAGALLGPLAIILGNVVFGLSFIIPQFVYDYRSRFLNSKTWEVIMIASSANLFTAFISFLIVVSSAVLILHRLFWPLAARSVYAVSHYALVRNSKLLGTFGTICLLGAFPSSGLLHKIRELL